MTSILQMGGPDCRCIWRRINFPDSGLTRSRLECLFEKRPMGRIRLDSFRGGPGWRRRRWQAMPWLSLALVDKRVMFRRMHDWLPRAIVPLGIGLVMALLRRFAPPPKPASASWKYDQRQVPEPLPTGVRRLRASQVADGGDAAQPTTMGPMGIRNRCCDWHGVGAGLKKAVVCFRKRYPTLRR